MEQAYRHTDIQTGSHNNEEAAGLCAARRLLNKKKFDVQRTVMSDSSGLPNQCRCLLKKKFDVRSERGAVESCAAQEQRLFGHDRHEIYSVVSV